jgi:hypothetical protein
MTIPSVSSSAMERSFEELPMQPYEDFSLSLSFCSAKVTELQQWKKKIRLWSTLLSSSTTKNVIKWKILQPLEERSAEKKITMIFGLMRT